jgi:hypothetical protein
MRFMLFILFILSTLLPLRASGARINRLAADDRAHDPDVLERVRVDGVRIFRGSRSRRICRP